ncbi:acyltransferase [uncultured Duncaniella sp.]|uniref:acyltransferase family protein n=1 Tax=uncultured Duncaniella sp. TaxID=2768039 RepID=UPI0025B20EAE|nr:acyltransferase [uncultured Duncaniella sp.]
MNKGYIPPYECRNGIQKKGRSSNLELYRIIVMLLIVAHHYVVNSGLIEIVKQTDFSPESCVMLLFGAWGKTGINCFVFITGYFMCRSVITGQKLLKLYLQIALYGLVIYLIFCITGHDSFSPLKMLWTVWPVKSIADGFVSCFIVFYLFIPFLNILVRHLDRKEHGYMALLLIFTFTLFPSIPGMRMTFNYVTWFMAIYILASYIRFYGLTSRISHASWGWLTLGLVILSSATVLGLDYIYKAGITSYHRPYFFISDSNKIFSLGIAITSFMYFKDMRIPQSRLINAVGGATFGVLLIHANSDTMRQWLWRETVDSIGHFVPSVILTLSYAMVSVLVIFVVCAGIDWFRGKYIEPHLIKFFRNHGERIRGRIFPEKS